MAIDFKIPESIDKALGNVADAPTKEIGKTIADLWYLVCGGISATAEKKRLRIAHSLELFKKELEQKLNSIPEGKAVEPNTQVVLTALQDAQFCAENETLRSMFSNLIAASSNMDSADNVHPSFSGIIKQLTALDAKNAILFKETERYPIATISLKTHAGNIVPMYRTVFLGNPEVHDIKKQSMSITLLSKLGLLTIVNDAWMTDDAYYAPFRQLHEYKQLEESAKASPHYSGVDLGKGFVEIQVVPLTLCKPS